MKMQQGPQGYGPPQGYQQQPPQKQGMSTLVKVLIALLVIGVTGVGGCVVCVGIGAKVGADAITDAAASAKKVDDTAKAAAITVGIDQLLNDYKANEVRADEAYKGKYIVTGGIVQDVKKDLGDSIYVTIAPIGAKGFVHPVVQCFPPDTEKADAMKLDKGSRVAVKGRVDGLLFNVLVKECALTLSAKDKAK
jgi:hypothetical protein